MMVTAVSILTRSFGSVIVTAMAAGFALGLAATARCAEPPFPWNAQRIVFLGDSNTYAGGYIVWLEEQLRGRGITPEILNLGLPSETCSGLSEPEHPFPRPNVHERLARVLSGLRPDVVVACYGMNDGIYHPFSESRFEAYQEGINRLIHQVHAAGAKLVLMTPPAFDPQPMRRQGKLLPETAPQFAWFAIYEHYDQVMQKYADWIGTLNQRAELVVDLHSPTRDYLVKQRQANPDFSMSDDGVHVDAVGHALMGQAILTASHVTGAPLVVTPHTHTILEKRQQILRDAWLTQTGHQRPGMTAGLPVAEAEQQAAQLLQTLAP